MDIVFAMILSITIKAISAVVEIAIQLLITNGVGVSEYDNYTFFVSLIEGAYFVLFSGIIKLNTFYLSTPAISISDFKKKYVLRYVMPIILVIVVCFAILHNPYGILAAIILGIYYFAFDTSSVFFSRGFQLPALLGEYLLGRISLLIGVAITMKFDVATGLMLLALYGIQFVTMLLWFAPHRKKLKSKTEETKVSMRKLIEYQISDIATSLISYSPVILQYIFGGSFTAGVIGIISIVKKFINFISGPTAKIFLPEFSRLYKKGEREKLEQSYLMIVRIQMTFIGTIGTLFICFPKLLLHMFNPELEQYANIFTGTAISLLVISGIGPVTGMLQMTGNEKKCNRNQWISIGAMILVWIVFRKQQLFVVYGLCVQSIVEGGLKYISVCKWFEKNVIPIRNYVLLWLPVVLLRVVVDFMGLQMSFFAVMGCVTIVFIWNAAFAIHDPMVKESLSDMLSKQK